MKKIISTILLLILMCPAISTAKWNDKEGNILEDTEWMKSSGDFGAQLVLIGDEKEFFERWGTPSEDVHLNTISKLQRGESLITSIIFAGCYVNKDGNCNVVTDINIIKPDGTSYGEANGLEVWVDKPAPPKSLLELGVDYMKIIIEPEDPLGVYSVQAKVTDNIKKSSFTLVQKFTVSDEPPIQQKVSKTEKKVSEAEIKKLSRWFTYYYKDPQPETVEDNIEAMVVAGFFGKQSAVGPLIMFLSEVFRQNEKLLPAWEQSFAKLPFNSRGYIAQALWESNTTNGKKIIEKWKKEGIVEKIDRIISNVPIDLKNINITSPAMLDMLWASFMASGDKQYIERIIGVLAYPDDSPKQEERLNNIMLIGAAKWSLSSNAFQHDLVYEICEKYAKSEDPNTHEAIVKILAKADEAKEQKSKD